MPVPAHMEGAPPPPDSRLTAIRPYHGWARNRLLSDWRWLSTPERADTGALLHSLGLTGDFWRLP